MTDISAIFLTSSAGAPVVRHITKNMSPAFLFTAPLNLSTMPCTISATWLTKVMTLPWSTSVAVLKLRMPAQPMMQSTREPSMVALTPEVLAPLMLLLTMFVPASPKPSANKEPNLMIVFSKMTVSIKLLRSFANRFLQQRIRLPSSFEAFMRNISSRLNSSSAIFIATRGSSRMASTLVIICSTGCSTNWLASLVNSKDAMHKTTQMKAVLIMLNDASSRVYGLKSK
mmetsp:Transcript_26686/g.76903  ORF Transcript_26686/g.76903 Transcript_26686/m.76903 type:complete len:228 (+) Transcript_26686:813-1496(+)